MTRNSDSLYENSTQDESNVTLYLAVMIPDENNFNGVASIVSKGRSYSSVKSSLIEQLQKESGFYGYITVVDTLLKQTPATWNIIEQKL